MPIPLLGQRSQVAIKVESVPGVPETLADADVILTTERPTYEPDVQITERNALTRSLDQRGHVVGARAAKINFKMYMRGTESTPVDPTNLSDFALPFRACGFVVDVSGGVQTYTMNSDAVNEDPGAYFTVGIFIDGRLYAIHGAQADLTIVHEIGKPVLFEFAFTGVYAEPIDTSMLNPSYTTVVEPPFLGATFSVLGFSSPKFKTMTLKIGNTVTLRPDPNDVSASGYFTAQITGRKMTGTFDPEETFATEKNWWNEWTSGASGTIDTGIYPSDGEPFNMFQFVMDNVQYHTLKQADRSGIITTTNDFAIKAVGDAGDDALVITVQ